jgi:predicted RNase H-like HicB family nuclease
MSPTAAPRRFRIALHRWRGGYIACAIDLPGCLSHGDTEVEAVESLRACIRAYLRVVNALQSERATVELEISA